MQRSTAVRFTYQDLLSLPEDESRRHEILDGKLYVTPGPRFDHQRVATNLLLVMAPLVRGNGLGEVVGPMTVHVHDELVFEPDLIFIRADRMHVADPDGHVHGVPDLVIEILSPSTRSYDRALKRKYYLEAGVAELWLVDIDERMVEVWRPGDEEPEQALERVAWRVGDISFEIPFEEVFRGVGPGPSPLLDLAGLLNRPCSRREPRRAGSWSRSGGTWRSPRRRSCFLR